jgi:hypothetical protein
MNYDAKCTFKVATLRQNRRAFLQTTKDGMKVMPPIFFQKCNCNYKDIYMDNSYIFCNYGAIFPQSLCHFQHISANTKTLYISVVKYPASTLEHITNTLFKFVVICKVVST